MNSNPSVKEGESVTVIFLDVRNFTLLLDNYGESTISDLLDTLFSHVREIVTKHGGTIDKIIGDGIMVTFEGDSTAQNALSAATEIYQMTDQQTDHNENVGSVNIGIGIATGKVTRTDIANIDSTVIGRCVNVAARLEGLCKEYEASILMDETTHNASSIHNLPDGYTARKIPDQNLRGIQQTFNIYHICDTSKFSEKYISLFNEGVEEFIQENYDKALNAFTEAYTCDERYTDQALLNHFTNSCLNLINDDRALFRNPDRYEEHSGIQQKQSITLLSYVERAMMDRNITPSLVLDVGCGPGKVTERLATRLDNPSVIGIDPSRSAIAKARTEHSPENMDIKYQHYRVEDYCPKEKRDSFDLIFSNSAMHWVEDQHKGYENLRKLISEDGLLAVHQGHKGTYKELHQVAVEVLKDFDYHEYFENLNPPLDLIYYNAEEMRDLLTKHGFNPIEFDDNNGSAPESIIDDFAEASLNAYCDRLENESQRDVFREQFKRRARNQLEISEITVHRLYVVAEPVTN